MSKKYIIEIEEEPFIRKSPLHGEEALYRAVGFNSLVFDKNGLDKLTPFDDVPSLSSIKIALHTIEDAISLIMERYED